MFNLRDKLSVLNRVAYALSRRVALLVALEQIVVSFDFIKDNITLIHILDLFGSPVSSRVLTPQHLLLFRIDSFSVGPVFTFLSVP